MAKDEKALDDSLEALDIAVLNLAGTLASTLPQLLSLVSYTPGDALSGATFARASQASYIDQNGVVQTAASGAPRDGHYIGATRTYLSEPAATNILLQSADTGNATWGKAKSGTGSLPVVTSNYAKGPDLVSNSAQRIIFGGVNTGSTNFCVVHQTPAGQPASPQTFSVWLRGLAATGNPSLWISCTADNITYQRTLCVLTNSWKRFSVTSGSVGSYRFQVGVDLRDASQTTQPQQDVNIFAPQVETGTVATSTILPLSTTVSVTRAADALTIPWTTTPAAMSVYMQVIDQGIGAQADATGKAFFSIGSGAARFTATATSTPAYVLNYRTASTDHTASDTASLAAFGQSVEFISTLATGGAATFQHSLVGAAVTTGGTTSATIPGSWGANSIDVGHMGGTLQGSLAIVGFTVVAGVVALLRARSAARTPIPLSNTTPSAITLTPNPILLNVGAPDITLAAAITNSLGNVIPGAVATYGSSDATVATVNSTTGAIHAVSPGTVTITGTTANSIPATATVTIGIDSVPVAVVVTPSTLALAVGATDQFAQAVVTNQYGLVLPAAVIAWTTSASSVATVSSSGVIHPVLNGTATITATSTNGKTGTCVVTVAVDSVPAGIVLAPASLALTAAGADGTLVASVRNAGGAPLSDPVLFSSSAPANATVTISSNEPPGFSPIASQDNATQGFWLNPATGLNTTPPVGTVAPWSWVFDSDLGQNVTRLTYGPWDDGAGAGTSGTRSPSTYTPTSTPGPGTGYLLVGNTRTSFYCRIPMKMSAGFKISPSNDLKLMQFFTNSAAGYNCGTILQGATGASRFMVFENNNSQPDRNGVPLGQNPTGTVFVPPPPDIVTAGVWHTFELLYGANTPGVADGYFVTWLDGKQQTIVTDMRWVDAGVTGKLFQLQLGALWGGQGGVLTAAQYVDVGPIYISGGAVKPVGPFGAGATVHPLVAGSTTITAKTSNGITATASVAIASSAQTPNAITVFPTSYAAVVGAADVTLVATVKNAALATITDTVTWTSSAPGVITVSSAGVLHVVASGNAVVTAHTSNGITATCAVTISPAPPTGRTLRRPHARRRIIQRWPTGADDTFANDKFDDIDGGSLASHPTALDVQRYAILLTTESNGENDFDGTLWAPPTDFIPVMFPNYTQAYASSHGLDPESFWLHARSGQANNVAGIWSISPAGVVLFYSPVPGGGNVSSFPYVSGQTVTLSGLSAGNGTYTIESLQKFGISLNGWAGGQLGPTGAVPASNTHIGTVSTVGDGTLTLANRLQMFGWASWVLFCNFSTAAVRQMHAQRFIDSLTLAGQTVNGFLIDNMASGNYTNPLYISQEYGATPAPAQYVTDVASALTAIRTAPGGPAYLRINTSLYELPSDQQLATAAGGIHGESLLSLFNYDRTSISWAQTLVNLGIDVEYSNGDTYTIAGGVATGSYPGSFNAGNYPTATLRAQMAMYTQYLQFADATFTASDGSQRKHAIFCNTNGFATNQTPLSALEPLGFDYNIGQPVGGTARTQTTDASANAIYNYIRSFSLDGGTTLSAVVTYNHNVNGQTNYGDTSLTTVTLPAAPAGQAWFQLNADGTLGTAAFTTSASRRAEGMIFIAKPSGTFVANSGSDTTGNGSIGAPYKTLGKANTVAPANSVVHAKGGDTFRETVTYTGTSVTYDSYGTGQARVTGADLMTGYVTAAGTTTFSKSGVTTAPLMVYVNNVRWPKGASATTLTDGQWFWASNVLYLCNAGGNPDTAGLVVEASQRSYAFNSNSHTGLQLVNLLIDRTQHTSNGAIMFDGVGTLDGIGVTRCTIRENYTTAIYVHQDSMGGVFTFNTLADNGQHGLWVAANPTAGSQNQIITDNQVTANGWRTDPAVNFPSGIIGSIRSGEIARNTIRGNGLGGSGGHAHGIYVSSDLAPGLLLLVHDNECSGQLNGFGLKCTQDATIYSNKFFNNTGGGANLGPNSGTNNVSILFYKNVIYDNCSLGGAGIDISRSANTGSLSVRGYNNTTYNNSPAISAGEVNVESSLLLWDWRNNIHYASNISNAKYIQSVTQSGGSVTVDYNHYFGSPNSTPWRYNNTGMSFATWRAQTFAPSIDAHGAITDPIFNSITIRDLTLDTAPIVSPCIDTGVIITGITDGFLGAAPDKGYQEAQ